MKRIILVGVLLLLLMPSISAVYDYFGVNDKYAKPLQENYENVIDQLVPNSGLLEVSCLFWENHVSMTDTVDNTSTTNVGDVLYAGLRTYINFYNDYGFPNKAEININKPGGQFGTRIASGTVYSKWVEDYNEERIIDAISAQKGIIGKFADTARESG